MARWVAVAALLAAAQALRVNQEIWAKVPHSYAHDACMTDDNAERKLNDKAHFEWRDSLLKWAQPWKYEEETLKKYREEPKIKKVYYINAGDGRRVGFMEDTLKSAEGIPHEKFQATTRLEVEQMPVNGGVPQDAWDFSSGGMAQYLKDTIFDDVVGTVGVYLSHAKLLQKIAREDGNSTDIYAIMEDDAALDPYWDTNVLEAVKALPADWDIARLVYWGGKRCQDAVPNFKEGQDKTLWYEALQPNSLNNINLYGGNQAYIFRPKSIENIMKNLRELPVMDFDGAVDSNHKLYQETPEGQENPVTVAQGLYTYVMEMPVGRHQELYGSERIRNDWTHPRNTNQGKWGETGKKSSGWSPFSSFR